MHGVAASSFFASCFFTACSSFLALPRLSLRQILTSLFMVALPPD